MMAQFLIKFFPYLERISENRITSRELWPPHSTALKPCNYFLLVVHASKFFTNCKLDLWFCKSQNYGTNAMERFERYRNQTYD